ncbi:MAG: hypothetical protein KIT80_13850 [Chitinophagaceae bacterium]|nr:hypothetical protein [Chitinophagaceae bacterium]MCW5927994.1 hypothetical protein [Chitinophagaceae bacterium]
MKGQKDATLDVKKPEKYENRVLGSDKTFTTKYTVPRKLVQNTTTHYNYYFNANIKIENVIAGAKQSFKDDYTELLPFYNYSLETTSAQKVELDSVLQKCNAAILLHDLRNEWVDDMYLLMGKAFFLKKDFDSAFIVFQYINYYFQPKTKEELGFRKYIGSNLNEEGNVYSVSTSERRSLLSRMFNKPPGRNDALLWLLHTLIEDSLYTDASAFIETLRRDELFPERLKPLLEEKRAYLFYKHQQWDSTAFHLTAALDNASGLQEKARWEFLIAQLHALGKNNAEAEKFYNLAIRHTVDPVLEVYARLNIIKLTNGDDTKVIEENISKLLKMARRDQYYNYRGIIYYMAAQMEMQRDNYNGAKKWLLKGVTYNKEDLNQRNRSYLYLGDIAFSKRDYVTSYAAYDSLDAGSPVVKDQDEVVARKEALVDIVKNVKTIHLQDSLQQIAAMEEEEREKFLKAAVKRLRKERGIKDAASEGFSSNNPLANKQGGEDMFAGAGQKGDWYFYNNASKSRGFTSFRSMWGNRPNIDNWRRQASLAAQLNVPRQNAPTLGGVAAEEPAEEEDISYEGLLKKIPLTEEDIQTSRDSIQMALFDLGKIFKDRFEDYREAINNYEALLERFPETPYEEETLFNLHYCYTKLGLPVKAKQYKASLDSNFKQSHYRTLIDNPKALQAQTDAVRNEATKNYEEIYNLFVEGNFEEALQRKYKADSIYGSRYWTQQLLYIESVYYIKQRQDEDAIESLQNLIRVDKEAPISQKAQNIIDVVKRRAEIEKYLTELEIETAEDAALTDSTVAEALVAEPEPTPRQGTRETISRKEETPRAKEVTAGKQDITRPPVDSSAIKRPVIKEQAKQEGFTYDADEAHYAVVLLNRVDGIYISEAKNAFNRYNRENFSAKGLDILTQPLDDAYTLLLTTGFEDAGAAAEYLLRTVKLAGTQIVPWLAAGKYSLTVISESNLKILLTNKDVEAYQRFAEENYPSGN